MRLFAVALLAVGLAARAQEEIDPALRAAVERFYATQEAEDIPGYLSLWASTAQRPQPAQLKVVFDSGDDKFSAISIERVRHAGDRTIVRVSVLRDRTSAGLRRPDGSPITMHSAMRVSLTYVREGTEWKLVREGSAVDGLAEALLAAASAAEREQLLAAEPELVGPTLVSALSRHGDMFALGRQYERAQNVYERVLEIATRIGDRKSQGEVWQNIGNALYFQRNFAGALDAYDHRLAIEREIGNEPGIANALLGTATVLYSQFEYGDALAKYREALSIHERLRDTSGIATTLISTGNIQFVQGDFPAAIADYRRSRDLFHQATDTAGEASAYAGLGRTYTAQGDFGAALDAYAFVLKEGQARSDRSMQGSALQNAGEIHLRLGNLDVARAHFDQSRAHFEALNDAPNVGRVWQATGMTDLVAGRFAAAEQEYAKSTAACGKGPLALQDADCIARGIVGTAFAQAAQQHYEAAISSYRSGIAAFVALGKVEDSARAEIGLSQALTGNKDYAAAVAIAGHAREQAAAIRRDDVLWRAFVAEARGYRHLSNPQGAMSSAKSAVATVQRLINAFEEQPGELVAPDVVGAYALLAVLQAEAGDADAVFTTVEERRAHALRLALAGNERDIRRGMTDSEREEERRLAIDVTSTAAQLHHEKALPRPDAARVARLQERLSAAVAARTAARQKLFDRLPALRIWRGLAGPASAEEAVLALGARPTLFAEFVVDEDNLLVVMLAANESNVKRLAYLSPVSRQTLAQQITRALDPATLRSADAWHDASVELMKSIPSAAWAQIAAASRVMIAPDDVLWHVPFEALPVEGGILADRATVAYTASATSLLPPRVVPARAPAIALLAIASPELSATVRGRVTATSPEWTVRPAGAAESEARTVAALFDSAAVALVGGQAATESAFREQAAAAALIHVAAPFRVNTASPLFSPILLTADAAASDSAPERDGVLEAREVMNLDLQARVVVFSDGTALSMRGAAPAVEVARWAWRASGVPAIVLPRWAADDAVATGLLEEFYKQLKAGAEVDDALQRARAAVRAREETRAPFFWAGWMVVGPGLSRAEGPGLSRVEGR